MGIEVTFDAILIHLRFIASIHINFIITMDTVHVALHEKLIPQRLNSDNYKCLDCLPSNIVEKQI